MPILRRTIGFQGETDLKPFGGIITALCLLACSAAAASEVIVNAGVAEERVSRALLRGIFGMRVRVWPDGRPVHVFVLDDGARDHEAFCKSVLRVYPYQLEQSWDRLVYSGTGQPPTRVSGAAAMQERVAATPGAIGYLPQRPEPLPEEIRVLNVQ